MFLTKEEERILNGEEGYAAQKSMEILCALGKIYNAEKLIPISSAQISGVSYSTIGDAGIEFLEEVEKDGKVKVLTTLNPAGMDLENWKKMGISERFAKKQKRIIDIFKKIGVLVSCTCTPYLIGNLPTFNSHISWSESSAVCFANSVLGAKTNREGGPSALASALIGKTPEYGLHINNNRGAEVLVKADVKLQGSADFGAFAYAISKKVQKQIPYIIGVKGADMEELKSFCASLGTFSGVGIFHMEGITPNQTEKPKERVIIEKTDLRSAYEELNDGEEVDFVCLGCPHLSINEIHKIAHLLKGKKVKKEFWLASSRQIKVVSDLLGYTDIIENSGGIFACDTCMVVAPLRGRFNSLLTDSAKACYYGRGANKFKVRLASINECVKKAVEG